MVWRRKRSALEWHRCSNCWDFPQEDFVEFEGGSPDHRPGGAEENPVCERCEELLESQACEE